MIEVTVLRHNGETEKVTVDADEQAHLQGEFGTLLVLYKGEKAVASFSQWSYAVNAETSQ